jgi:hypothetical protein
MFIGSKRIGVAMRNLNTILRIGGASVLLLALAGCSSESTSELVDSSEAPALEAEQTPPPEEPEVVEEPSEVEEPVAQVSILEAICDTEPAKVNGGEPSAKESWDCEFEGEPVRVALFSSPADLNSANEAIKQYYEEFDDSRSLAELPMLCGSDWRAGFNFNSERDSLLQTLQSAGVEAGLCS